MRLSRTYKIQPEFDRLLYREASQRGVSQVQLIEEALKSVYGDRIKAEPGRKQKPGPKRGAIAA